MTNQGLLLGRLLLGMPFVVWGVFKLSGGAVALSGALTRMNLPAPLFSAYFIGLCELIGGLAIVIGFPFRIAAILLALWCVATGILVHGGDLTQLNKNIVMAGGFFTLFCVGPGTFVVFGNKPSHS